MDQLTDRYVNALLEISTEKWLRGWIERVKDIEIPD
jgi:7,8-dihydro-6-hydroxymethylpterin-pyrophosphokinase